MQIDLEMDLILEKKTVVKTAASAWVSTWVPAINAYSASLKGKATKEALKNAQETYKGNNSIFMLLNNRVYTCIEIMIRLWTPNDKVVFVIWRWILGYCVGSFNQSSYFLDDPECDQKVALTLLTHLLMPPRKKQSDALTFIYQQFPVSFCNCN